MHNSSSDKSNYHRYSILPCLIFILLLVISSPVLADNIEEISMEEKNIFTLEEAIEYGIQESPGLNQSKMEVERLERNLADVRAGLGLNIGFSGEYEKPYDSIEDSTTGMEIEPDDSIAVDLQAGMMLKGVNLYSTLSSDDTDPFEMVDLQDNYELQLGASRQIFPFLPAEQERELERLKIEVEKARSAFKNEKQSRIIEWFESYSELIKEKRLLQVVSERKELAREELERVERQKELGEAGEIQIQEAEINLREARLQYRQQQRTFEREKAGWKRELGLPSDIDIVVDEKNSYIDKWMEKMDELKLDKTEEELWERVKSEHESIQGLEMDMEFAEKELEYSQWEKFPELEAEGLYDYQKKDWRAAITLSYDIYDGGQTTRKIEEKEEEVKLLEMNYEQTLDELKQQLKDLLEGVENVEEDWKIKQMQKDIAIIEAERAEKQLKEGIITEVEYRTKELSQKEAEIEFAATDRSLLFAEMRLLQFVEKDILSF